jgi:methylthioribulose-1-phosphate dehydratase
MQSLKSLLLNRSAQTEKLEKTDTSQIKQSKMGCSCASKKKEISIIETTKQPCCSNESSERVSSEDNLVISSHPEHPANLICELCRMFYNNGWVTGTGGGISVRDDDKIFLAPSGVQKERMLPENIFVMSFKSQEYIRRPLNLKPSACTPLFMAAYSIRNAGACIHTHSQSAVMCTLLFDKVFEISSIEQIKALPKITEPGNMWYSDKLVIPIIENTEREEELESSLRKAIEKYPSATAVLVRRHGIYVWGETVWKAKIYNEAIDYLLELAIKMKQLNIPTVKQE